MKTTFYLSFYFLLIKLTLNFYRKKHSYGDEVAAVFYYCRSFFICGGDFVAGAEFRLIIFLTYLIKVTIKKNQQRKNFKFIIPYFL